jgi:hypothetical protein
MKSGGHLELVYRSSDIGQTHGSTSVTPNPGEDVNGVHPVDVPLQMPRSSTSTERMTVLGKKAEHTPTNISYSFLSPLISR